MPCDELFGVHSPQRADVHALIAEAQQTSNDLGAASSLRARFRRQSATPAGFTDIEMQRVTLLVICLLGLVSTLLARVLKRF
jgi:hypothetical protein